VSKTLARFLAILVLTASCTMARAQGQAVHRCIGEHGEIVFSGVSCGASEIAAPHPAQGSATIATKSMAATTTCAASIDTLRTLIADALAHRDANAIAGILRWDGVGGGEARERMSQLAELAARPLLGVDIAAAGFNDSDDSAPGDPGTLMVRTGSSEEGEMREHAFRISARGGCYWLDW
jgi:hypothetical protein